MSGEGLVGSHQAVPKAKFWAEVSDIVRMMKVVLFDVKFPRKKWQLVPTPFVPTMHFAGFHNPKNMPDQERDQVNLDYVGQENSANQKG